MEERQKVCRCAVTGVNVPSFLVLFLSFLECFWPCGPNSSGKSRDDTTSLLQSRISRLSSVNSLVSRRSKSRAEVPPYSHDYSILSLGALSEPRLELNYSTLTPLLATAEHPTVEMEQMQRLVPAKQSLQGYYSPSGENSILA